MTGGRVFSELELLEVLSPSLPLSLSLSLSLSLASPVASPLLFLLRPRERRSVWQQALAAAGNSADASPLILRSDRARAWIHLSVGDRRRGSSLEMQDYETFTRSSVSMRPRPSRNNGGGGGGVSRERRKSRGGGGESQAPDRPSPPSPRFQAAMHEYLSFQVQSTAASKHGAIRPDHAQPQQSVQPRDYMQYDHRQRQVRPGSSTSVPRCHLCRQSACLFAAARR